MGKRKKCTVSDLFKRRTVFVIVCLYLASSIVLYILAGNLFSKRNFKIRIETTNSTEKAKTLNCLQLTASLVSNGTLVIPKTDILQTLERTTIQCFYHRYMSSLQYMCSSKERFGTIGPGGWTVCSVLRRHSPDTCMILIVTNRHRANRLLTTIKSKNRCHIHIFDQRLTTNLTTSPAKNTFVHSGFKVGAEQLINYRTNDIEILIIDDPFDYLPLMAGLLDNSFLQRVRQLVIRPYLPIDGRLLIYLQGLEILRRLLEEGFLILHVEREVSGVCRLRGKPNRTACYIITMIKNDPSIFRTASGQNDFEFLNSSVKFSQIQSKDHGHFYFQYALSPQIFCKQMVRVGNLGDGGWDLCDDFSAAPKPLCLVYSFGINSDFSFDDDVARTYGCEVHSFDPSMNESDHRRSTLVYFHQLWISSSDSQSNIGWNTKRLTSIMKILQHTNRIVDVLKMDIEGAEYEALTDIIQSNLSSNVRQLIFELHTSVGNDDSQTFQKPLTLLLKL